MTEKLHYEVRFIETDDGFRLEAKGDKEALKKLGIGPNMLNKQRRGRGRRKQGMKRGHGRKGGMGRGREFGTRDMKHGRAFGPQGMKRRRARRAAMVQRRHLGHRHGAGPGRWRISSEPGRGFRHVYGQEARSGARGHRGAPEYL